MKKISSMQSKKTKNVKKQLSARNLKEFKRTKTSNNTTEK